MRKSFFVVSFVLALFSTSALAGQSNRKDALQDNNGQAQSQEVKKKYYEAPFGLKWGMSIEDAKSLNIEMDENKDDGVVVAYKVSVLPSQPPGTDFAILIFSKARGLQKVLWNSTDIREDSNGVKGREEFKSYQSILEEKYGKPESKNMIKKTGLKLYKEADEFYQCLHYDGCGYWMAMWNLKTMTVLLEIRSSGRRGNGWLQIAYEGPEWDDALKDGREQDRQKKKASF